MACLLDRKSNAFAEINGMSYEFITSEQGDDGIVIVTINDPDARNAVNWVMNKELVAECDRIEADPAARVVIVTGAGKIFCSGGNIKRMTAQGKSLKPPNPTMREEMFPHEADMRGVVVALRRLTKPVIAAVNGPAIGSGLGIAAGCDIRIASSSARFGWVFLRRGIVPDDASLALMPQILGYSRTFEWGVTGRTLDAAGALANGFISEVVSPDGLMARCREVALEIIENCPPITVQLFKLSLAESMDARLEDAVRFTERAQKIARASEDHTEALLAYAEKRRPQWKGK
jgi:enoyl-CoA hydratase/carnithine racemase